MKPQINIVGMDAVDGTGARFSVVVSPATDLTLFFLERDLRTSLAHCGMSNSDIDAKMKAARWLPVASTSTPEEPSPQLVVTTTHSVPLAITFVPPLATLLTIRAVPSVSTQPNHLHEAAVVADKVVQNIADASAISPSLPVVDVRSLPPKSIS